MSSPVETLVNNGQNREAIVVVGDLGRFAADARRIVGDVGSQPRERDPSD